ncbi:MAG TPA: hypothetical protein VFZ78_01405 [Flavisolibacter sp.]
MTQFIILQHWKDYDVRKLQMKQDPRFFDSSVEWEVDYLVGRIRRVYSMVPELVIRAAVHMAGNEYDRPADRKTIVLKALQQLTACPVQ